MFLRLRNLVLGTLAALTLWGQVNYDFSDGGRKAAYILSTEELYSKGSTRSLQSAKSHRKLGSGEIYTLTDAAMKELRANRTERAGAEPFSTPKETCLHRKSSQPCRRMTVQSGWNPLAV